MIASCMIDNEINDNLDVPLVGFVEEPFEIGHCPIIGMHGLVVRHIVLVVGWRRHDRHKPNRVRAQLLDVVQFLGYPIEIAYPIAIAVVEGLHKNLISDPCLRPIVFGLLCCGLP